MDNQTNTMQDNKQDGQRFYHAGTGWQIIFSLTQDELECRIHLEVKVDGAVPVLDQVLGLLAADGIVFGIDNEALQQLLNEAKPGKSSNGTAALGEYPQRGKDGTLAYSFAPLEPPPTSGSEDTDTEKQPVDFRNVQQFINVDPDQEIGRILPPTSGIPGKTVRGKPVAAESGKPLLLKLGQNVRAGGDSGELLFAEIHGRVKLEGEVVHVVEEYVVDGDVDFSVGNIRFNGFVEIRGDVLDGFQVSASKGLKITGNVGSCRLISHGSIEFCGMDGQGKGSILCGGTLTAQFVHDSTVECWGAMHAAVELRNCFVHCRSSLTAGLLAGGEYIALSGIEAKKVGAPSAVKTLLHSGVDYHDLDRMHVLMAQLEELQEKLNRAKEVVTLNQLSTEKHKLMAAIVEVRSRRPEGSNPKISVKDKIHEGVTIYLGNAVEEFNHEESGPVSLIENSNAGGLRRLPLTALQITAAELEIGCRAKDEEERLQKLEQQSQLSEATPDEGNNDNSP